MDDVDCLELYWFFVRDDESLSNMYEDNQVYTHIAHLDARLFVSGVKITHAGVSFINQFMRTNLPGVTFARVKCIYKNYEKV